MTPWIVAVGVLAVLLFWEWERYERLLQRAERAEGELARLGAERVVLPSGARVEVFAWPEKVAACETARWN